MATRDTKTNQPTCPNYAMFVLLCCVAIRSGRGASRRNLLQLHLFVTKAPWSIRRFFFVEWPPLSSCYEAHIGQQTATPLRNCPCRFFYFFAGYHRKGSNHSGVITLQLSEPGVALRSIVIRSFGLKTRSYKVAH